VTFIIYVSFIKIMLSRFDRFNQFACIIKVNMKQFLLSLFENLILINSNKNTFITNYMGGTKYIHFNNFLYSTLVQESAVYT